MRIIFDVNHKTIVMAGAEQWNVGIGKPPAENFKASVTMIFQDSGQHDSQTIEFEGDSPYVMQTFRMALNMLEGLERAHKEHLAKE